jgi:hypothetical protein
MNPSITDGAISDEILITQWNENMPITVTVPTTLCFPIVYIKVNPPLYLKITYHSKY